MGGYNVVIIGSGAAGLLTTIFLKKYREDVSILVVSKSSSIEESNTYHAKGGIAAAVSPSDNIEEHIQDTLRAGAGLCDERAVRFIIEQSPQAVMDLVQLGVPFDIKGGMFHLAREGGHSRARILHVADTTGKYLLHTLYKKIIELGIKVMFNFFVTEIVVEEGVVKKVRGVWHRTQLIEIPCENVVVATGGVGRLYRFTSNPKGATGDGIALCHRAGALISGMEFIQFHPTALYSPEEDPLYLITEAVRGKGAILINEEGERFMFKYHPSGELAPRDIVTLGVYREMKKIPSVYLSLHTIDREELVERFPGLVAELTKRGYNPFTDRIPVVPAAHYLCGGVNVNLDGSTCIEGLYVNGESANTGLHGANRLASNSLLEIAVLSKQIAAAVAQRATKPSSGRVDIIREKITKTQQNNEIPQIINELRLAMNRYVYILKTEENLNKARDVIRSLIIEARGIEEKFPHDPLLIESIFMLETALLIVEQSLARKNSVGCFIREDEKEKEVNHNEESSPCPMHKKEGGKTIASKKEKNGKFK